jgi:cobalt-precorrin 5A hydrolase
LAAVPVTNPSETVRKYMGTPVVAEAAALLASRGERVMEKHKDRAPTARTPRSLLRG